MTAKVKIALTWPQAQAIHEALSMIENDPDWVDMMGGARAMRCIIAGHDTLLDEMTARRANRGDTS